MNRTTERLLAVVEESILSRENTESRPQEWLNSDVGFPVSLRPLLVLRLNEAKQVRFDVFTSLST